MYINNFQDWGVIRYFAVIFFENIGNGAYNIIITIIITLYICIYLYYTYIII